MQTLFPTIHGYRVNTGIELSKGWTPEELKNVMYGLASDPADRDLLLESCSGFEADKLLNPGTMILEAVTAQYNRLPRTMAALGRVLGRYLGDGLTVDGEPFIGPDRKNALFAYKVVTFNISDGQAVSVLFHSPDNDPKRFQPEETLIAYRWMLNKRDITASVAPERGRDITLELMARRMAQLIESNSAKFQEQAAARDARMAELEQATARRDELSAMSAQLADEIVSFEDELQAIQARASRTAERLESERTRAERLRGAGVGAGVGDTQPEADQTASTGDADVIKAKLIDMGGSEWQSGTRHRFYFSDWLKYSGLELDRYKTGNIKGATLNGEEISNSKAYKMANGKLYYDVARGEFIAENFADTTAVKQAVMAMREILNGATQPDTQPGDAGAMQPEPTQPEGQQARVLPFLMTENGNATVYAASGTEAMPSNWTGIAVDGSDVKSFWYIGLDGGERTWNKLQATTYVQAQAEVAARNLAATTNPDKPSSTEAFATTPYADPRTRYAAALAEELAMAGFTPYDFPVNQSDFELGQYTAVAGMEMVAGRASVYVDSVEAGQAKVTARFSPESQPGMPVPYSPSQEFTFPVPVGVLEGKFDDVVGEISGWLAQFGTAFDNVNLPEFGSKLKTEGVNEHDAADIAKRIRQDIKEVLPPGFKPSFISVKTSKYSMGQSIGITIKQLPDGFPMYETKASEDQYGRKSYQLTRDAAALLKTLKAIGNAYRFDNSEPETDYFHTNFYFNVSFDSALENEQRALAEQGSQGDVVEPVGPVEPQPEAKTDTEPKVIWNGEEITMAMALDGVKNFKAMIVETEETIKSLRKGKQKGDSDRITAMEAKLAARRDLLAKMELAIATATGEPQPDQTPGNDPEPQEQTVNEAEAIGQELQKLANGEVTDTGLFDQMLDDLADRAEKAGAMDELDALLNAAADKLTELLEKEAANVA